LLRLEVKRLFTPIQIGQLHLHNRVMMGSMHTGLEGTNQPEEALLQFYRERAGKEGPALIVTGGISVSLEGEGGSEFLGFYREKDCGKMARLTEAVHQEEGMIAAQLFHAGRYAYPEFTGVEAVAPSALRSPIHRHTPRELSSKDIEQLIDQYAYSARKAKELGFDAIEIMGSEGYLINQFLSPVTNKRNDHWGGSFDKRIRFALEVIVAVRVEVGQNYPIIFRLSGTDLIPDSTTEEETMQFAKLVEASGVDAINIGIGWHESQVPTISMMVPRAGFIDVARSIKQHVRIPVIGSNRINDPRLAEQLLVDGSCDMISMARPFLADPDLLSKAKKAEFDRINTCIACNQACLDHVFEGKRASCLVNPRAGREAKWPMASDLALRNVVPRQVVVLGGGPAGMEASRALAEKGESVTLFEAGSEIGGQLNLAKRIPNKSEFRETLRFFTHELKRLGVNVQLNTRPTIEQIKSMKPDLVVIATGVKPRIPDIPGIGMPHVYHYQQVFDHDVTLGKRIVIIGAGGIGCDVAHYLLDQKEHDIVLLCRKGKIGEGLGKTTRWTLIKALFENGVQFLTNLSYSSIKEDGVYIDIHTEKGMEHQKIAADHVIIAAGQEAMGWDGVDILQQEGIEVVTIGGARFPGELDAKRAIYEGAKLAYF
jgi:2,4-dienoyl-CoA reductase (NADPH2)